MDSVPKAVRQQACECCGVLAQNAERQFVSDSASANGRGRLLRDGIAASAVDCLQCFFTGIEQWPELSNANALQQLGHVLRGIAEYRLAATLLALCQAAENRTDNH
jgi:hypothetical protein